MEPPRTAEPPPPPPPPPMYESSEDELAYVEAITAAEEHIQRSVTPFQEVYANSPRPVELRENEFQPTTQQPISTFSTDADGASYAHARRQITQYGGVDPRSVRVEEFINYFDLDYPVADARAAISLNGEVSTCPWARGHQLVRIGIQGRNLRPEERAPANFVFLIDVSGSMAAPDKLPLLKEGFKLFVDEMGERDRVAIVTYAGRAGLALPSTSGRAKTRIKAAIDGLGSGGSTAGAAGILTAYEIAEATFLAGGNNRIIIGTDGDFNVGPASHEEIINLIEQKRESNIFLTVLGFGDHYNDYMLEQLANKGNGTAEYIDNASQLRKVFLYDYDKFQTVAKDVKVQVKFNPNIVASYRLIGYENRMLATEDFMDDSKDAGEIGAGQNVTALYEIIPSNVTDVPGEAFTIDFRYKEPDAIVSQPLQLKVYDRGTRFEDSSPQHQFVAGVASFALQLRQSEYSGSATLADARDWAMGAGVRDDHGLKQELWDLMRLAQAK